MQLRILKISCFICLAIFNISFAQNITKVATTAAPFLTIGIGARAQAMGGAFTAVANDASAMFWNVGGAAQLNNTEIIVNHSDWIADIDYNYGGVVFPISNIGNFGVGIMHIDYGEFEQTTENNPEGTGVLFSAKSIAINLSYSRMLTDRFMIGFTGKYVEENIYNSSASGMAVDIGFLYETPFPGLRLGMNISNFGTKMQMSGDDLLVKVDIDQTINGNNDQINSRIETGRYDLPLLFRFGLSYELINNENSKVIIAADALHPNDNAESVNVGTEFRYKNLLAFRAGYRSLFLKDSEEGLTLGGGLLLESYGIRLDYAYESFGNFNSIQKYTLHLIL
ncbi:MAG: PorV/PorQ family protein [Melioribacteraceae bacterium]|nr:PorV/PorQ family protein [Melioribacteraceae bacterium]